MINRVLNEKEALICDELLSKLIQEERKYDDYIIDNITISNYFNNVIKNDSNILLCYKIEDNIVGYIYFKYQTIDDKNGYLIDGLYVIEKFRNKGIGKSLIKEGLNIVKKSNIDFIDINVMVKNEIALNLYKSFGFELFKLKLRLK